MKYYIIKKVNSGKNKYVRTKGTNGDTTNDILVEFIEHATQFTKKYDAEVKIAELLLLSKQFIHGDKVIYEIKEIYQ